MERTTILAIESSLPIASEGSGPDIFTDFVAELFSVVAPASLGGPDMDPDRYPIDGAGVARRFDEGLDEHGRDIVSPGSVQGTDVSAQNQPAKRRNPVMSTVLQEAPLLIVLGLLESSFSARNPSVSFGIILVALASPVGFEPATSRLGIWCSILLSYGDP